jgi:hypothetical protein
VLRVLLMRYFNPENDADWDMQALINAGNAAARGRRIMRERRAKGDLAGAAQACPHGSGYPTNSPAATNASDPRAGQRGYRCTDCGSHFATITNYFDLRGATATTPCELEVK